jgi:hypothetical protein
MGAGLALGGDRLKPDSLHWRVAIHKWHGQLVNDIHAHAPQRSSAADLRLAVGRPFIPGNASRLGRTIGDPRPGAPPLLTLSVKNFRVDAMVEPQHLANENAELARAVSAFCACICGLAVASSKRAQRRRSLEPGRHLFFEI